MEKHDEGTATDVNGYFILDASESSKVLIVQFVGYETRENEVDDLNTKDLVVELSPNIELNEVVVSKRRAGTILDRESPIQSQKITGAELCKAACCNLAESFETNRRLMFLMQMQLRELNLSNC